MAGPRLASGAYGAVYRAHDPALDRDVALKLLRTRADGADTARLLSEAQALAKVADALPGLGIVAAVLGIVITMQAIGGPPEEIGHSVAAALVGTFLGILASYGFVQPMASSMEHMVEAEGRYLTCIKAGLLAVYKGFPPAIAVEFARRTLPEDVRPTFTETEQACKGQKSDMAAAA